MVPSLEKKNNSVSMANTRYNKEGQESNDGTEETLQKRKNAPVADVDLETPEQSNEDIEKKPTEWTPMPNAEEQKAKTIESSSIANGNEVTDNTPKQKKMTHKQKRLPSRRDLPTLWR